MKLTVTPQIVDNRYSVIIKFKDYGSTKLTSEMEQKIINDYSPKFKLSDLTFEGNYILDSDGRVVKAEDSDDTKVAVKLTIPNKEVAINSDLELGYTVHTKEIASGEIKGVLVDADKVAQAKIQLFVDVVTKEINTILTGYTPKLNDFEEEYEVEVG